MADRPTLAPSVLGAAILAALEECDPDAFVGVPVQGFPTAIDGHFDIARVAAIIEKKTTRREALSSFRQRHPKCRPSRP